jgi:hypothetical protein
MHTSFPLDAGELVVGRRDNVLMEHIELGDTRLDRVGMALHEAMVEHQSVCIRQLGQHRAGEVRFGRFLANPKTCVNKLIAAACEDINERCVDAHVLLIQDTSEINYQAHAGRVRGLGTVGNGKDKGLFIHPVLAVDAQSGACLGLAHVHLWQRTKAKATNYRSLPIEDKESHRWIEAPMQARARLGSAGLMTVVADRESDIFELWDRLPDERTHLLIRACHDRALQISDQGTLYSWLGAQPVQGSYMLELSAREGKRTPHQALMHVRFAKTRIMRPKQCSDKAASPSLEIWAIEVREDACSVVGKEAPIHWRLLSTHPIHSLEQAMQCVQWYCQRWHIEQTFRTLKRQGLDVESSLVEEARRLEKLAVLALSAAVHTMQLVLAREGNTDRPASDCMRQADYPMLEQVSGQLEGKTLKQKNPHTKHSLAWAAWIVARLGGWKGYASERKPGPITMVHGLQALANIRHGWLLARGE